MDWRFLRILVVLGVQAGLLSEGVAGQDCANSVSVNYQPLAVLCGGVTYSLTGAYTSTGCFSSAQYLTTTVTVTGTVTATITQLPSGTNPGLVVVQQPATSSASTSIGTCQVPSQVSGFSLYGCAVSSLGFPGFTPVASDPAMTLAKCAAICTSDRKSVV